MNQTTQNHALKVAAPYYGSLSHPTRGLTNLYFLLDIHPQEQRVTRMHVTVWNPEESSELGSWLQSNGVQTLFCNTIENCHRQNLDRSGIRIESITGHDIINDISRWLTRAGSSFFNQPVTGSCPA